jgi:hypothetical protein
MRIATLGRERSIATLAKNAYKIVGRDSAKLQLRAEAALLRANPHLATAEGFRYGSAVLVPNVKGLQFSDTVAVSRPDASGLTDETSLRLKAGAARIEESFQRFEKSAETKLELLDNTRFRSEFKKISPEADRLVAQSREQLKKSQVENKTKRASLQTAISNALEIIETLQKLAARTRTN